MAAGRSAVTIAKIKWVPLSQIDTTPLFIGTPITDNLSDTPLKAGSFL